MKTEVIVYYLPNWSLPALVNGDDSYCSDDEIEALDNFQSSLDETAAEYGFTNWHIGNISDSYFRHDNDIEYLAGDCADVDIVFSK